MSRQAHRGPAQGGGAASHLDGLIRLASAQWDRRVRLAVLAAGGVAMLGLLLIVGHWLYFWYDEWDFAFER